MNRIGRLGAALIACAVAAVSLAPGSQANGPQVTVAATGVKDPLYSSPATSPATWSNLGGRLASAPAVVVDGTGELNYIGIGTNGYLYRRTSTITWYRLAPVEFRCSHISARRNAIGDIEITCTGLNKLLYRASFSPWMEMPTFSTWMRIGGLQVDGAGYILSSINIVAKGPDYVTGDGSTANIYRYDGTAWQQTGIRCDTPPAVWRGIHSEEVLVCGLGAAGAPRSIYVRTDNFGVIDEGEFSGATDYAPAIQSNGDGTHTIAVQGLNSRVYVKTFSPDDLTQPWVNLGGSVKFGVALAVAGV